MKIKPLRQLAAVFALAAQLSSAWAINVCTDATGKTVYQDQPCQSLPPVTGNAPVPASNLSAANVMETVRRFNAALTARDVTTVNRFLASGLKVTTTNAKGTERYTREAFIAMLAQVLNAATSYESSARCGKVDVREGEATVQCELSERMVLMRRTQIGRPTETYKLVLNGGLVQFSEIVTQDH